ncbi:MAG: hypothetical protein R3C59_29635 [Planctomycetaceae bacterium]
MNAIKYIFAMLCGAILVLGSQPISDFMQNLRGPSADNAAVGVMETTTAEELGSSHGASLDNDVQQQPDVAVTTTSGHRPSDPELKLDPEIQARIDAVLGQSPSPRVQDSDPSAETESATATTDATEPAADIDKVPTQVALSPPKMDTPALESLNPIPDAFATRSSTEPIRHKAPLHDRMLTPGNFLYLGGFRPPHKDRNGEMYSLGGWGMTFRADGDPSGPDDGLPGSLYIVGSHSRQLVAEIAIPKPLISLRHVIDELPQAEELQALGDITGGIRERLTNGSSEPFQIGGMQYHDRRLFWTLYKYYNVETIDHMSHGASSPFTSRPFPEGMWHLGPAGTGISAWHSYKHAGYIFEIPDAAAKNWFGGRNLISGLQIVTGLNIASHGPAMYAYTAPKTGTPHGTALNAVPLVYNDIDIPAPDFHPSDRWTGGAWLTLGRKHAVIIVGRKALGPNYYGDARPFDCTPDKGFHGTPYQAQMLFYAPESLLKSARQEAEPTQVRPWLHWDAKTPGGDFAQYMFPTCGNNIGGVSYDRKHSLLYVCQVNAGTTVDREYEFLPVIHVFRIVE